LWGGIIRNEKRHNLIIRRKRYGGKNNTLKGNEAKVQIREIIEYKYSSPLLTKNIQQP
jgi:hypothetical protein